MSEPMTAMAILTERFDRLERENRRLKRLGGLALVGAAAIGLMGQAMPTGAVKVVEAEKLLVRDPAGQARAVVDSDGFRVIDGNGNPRASLVLLRDGSPTLDLTDGKSGIARASLTVAADTDAAMLDLRNRSGQHQIRLNVMPEGRAFVLLNVQPASALASPTVRVLLAAEGIFLNDTNGLLRGVFTYGNLVVLGEDGKSSGGLSSGGLRLQGGGLQLLDESGTRRASLATLPDGTPSLSFYEKDGSERPSVRIDTWSLWIRYWTLGVVRGSEIVQWQQSPESYASATQCMTRKREVDGKLPAPTLGRAVLSYCFPDSVNPMAKSERPSTP